MSVENIIQKTSQYLDVPSVIGRTGWFKSKLDSDFYSCLGLEICQTPNSISFSNTQFNSKYPTISSHIDRHGFIVNDKGQIEFAAFHRKKELGLKVGRPQSLYETWAKRVLGYRVQFPDHNDIMQEAIIIGSEIDHTNELLTFTLDDYDSLPQGTVLNYFSKAYQEDEELFGQIDNVISAAVIYQLFLDGFKGSVVFTEDEECGESWCSIANHFDFTQTNSLVVLDTTPYQGDKINRVHNGSVILRLSDHYGYFNQELLKNLERKLTNSSIPFEVKDQVVRLENPNVDELDDEKRGKLLGKTELGKVIEQTNNRINGITIQLPTYNYHTNHETTSVLALENFYGALKLAFNMK